MTPNQKLIYAAVYANAFGDHFEVQQMSGKGTFVDWSINASLYAAESADAAIHYLRESLPDAKEAMGKDSVCYGHMKEMSGK